MFFVLLSVILVLIVVKYLLFRWKFRSLEQLPGPKTHTIFGNIFEFQAGNFFQNLNRLNGEYGPIFTIWLGFSPTIIISNATYIEQILSSSVHIKKSQTYKLLKDWLGNGLFTCDEHTWWSNRKLLTPTFHFKILEGFLQIFDAQADILVKKLKEALKEDELMNVYPYLNCFALDNICETSMGISINVQDNPNLDYIAAVGGYLKSHTKRCLNVLMRNDFFYKFTKTYDLQQNYLKRVSSFTKSIIEKRKMQRENQVEIKEEINGLGIKRKTVLLDLLLEMVEANIFTPEDVRAEVETFMFGGHDTISTTISFALYQLAKHRKIQEEVFEEIEAHYDGTMSSNFLQNLSLMERVFKETLRLYPVVPSFERELTEDVKMNGITIPASTTISIYLHLLHYSEEYFPEPMKFDPDRFLPENCARRNPYAYLPFSAGPRNCIGQRYSWLVLKTCLAKILMNFEVFPVAGFEPIIESEAVIKSANGISVILRERKIEI